LEVYNVQVLGKKGEKSFKGLAAYHHALRRIGFLKGRIW